MKWTRSRTATVLAVGTASALLLSACSSSEEPTSSPSATSAAPVDKTPVTLNVNYWGNFGLEDGTLIAAYEKDHPWVTIKTNIGDYAAQHDALTQALIAGSGAANVAAIDEGYITGFVAQADGFVNLLDLGAGKYKENYLPWKWASASNADESVTIGLGTDVGGLALCYRTDLFGEAGLPTDEAGVNALIGDTWDGFIKAGEQYQAGINDKKKHWVDNATNILNPVQTQLGTGFAYYNKNNELDMDSNKPAFDVAMNVINAGLSGNIALWSDDWNTGFANGSFAVLACPAWMMGYIQGQAPETSGKWDIADIPGPGGNWGGSWWTVPAQYDEHTTQEAYNFVEWLIQPEQQITIFKTVGNLPSQESLYTDPSILDFKNEFFSNAPVGQIFTKTAADIPGPIYYAPKNSAVSTAVQGVLNDVQAGKIKPEDAWDAAVAAAQKADAAA
ncbi:MAG: extracellular solute-binding protein [Demequina sp.]|jgi:cellobiose transport system substrate-binding protein|nr:extracellular solute-binding protein [Demequina sp.]